MNAAPIRFDGEVAIVTGAGSGLGRSYAVELASRGASVVCNDVNGSAAAATATTITQQGGTAVPETNSVATPAGGAAIVQTAIDAFGSVEIVINNAGQLRNAAFEEVEANLDAACDLSDFEVPDSMNDESNFISEHMPTGAATSES